MPFEIPPITPTPEGENPETPETPPQNEEGAKQESSQEAVENTVEFLNPENQGLFNRMSESGKRIASQVYEGLYKTPGVNRMVGKLEIAYNQFWVDRHEEKAVGFKSKMDDLDMKMGLLDRSKEEIEAVVENFRQQGIPGVESLSLKLKGVDQQKMDLLNRRDKAQTRFEEREGKTKLYTNERDRVADKLIGHYDEKLEPMEKELESLQTYKDQVDLLTAVTAAKHREQAVKLGGIEERKTQIEETLREAGMSEREIRKFAGVKTLEELLALGRGNLKMEKENLARKRAEINKNIVRADAKANPYRDKREEFARVKEGRPIKMDVEARQRGEEFKGEKERLETSPITRESSTEIGAETEEDKERLETSSYISGWNAYLQEKYGKGEVSPDEMVDPKDFLKITKLSPDSRLDSRDFKDILTLYYRVNKMPTGKLNEAIDEFFNKETEGEEKQDIISIRSHGNR